MMREGVRDSYCNMASCTNNIDSVFQINSENNKLEMSGLRDRGLEYVSTTGRLIAAKSQPDVYCHCPQRCQRFMPRDKWKELFNQFYGMADQAKQNSFLRTHIQIKRLPDYNNGEKLAKHKRRVTCKYRFPVLQEGETIEKYLDELSENSIEVCQKAFMNVLVVTEKRVRQQREANISGKVTTPRATRTSDAPPEAFQNWLENYNKPASLTISACKKRKLEDEDEEEQPLDLSSHGTGGKEDVMPGDIPIQIDKEKLYQLAQMLGLPKETVNKEMVEKYEALVRKNLLKALPKKVSQQLKKSCPPPPPSPPQPTAPSRPMPSLTKLTAKHLKGISDQVLGLQGDMAILQRQTVNNGDLTITPVLSSTQPVPNNDIMQVNNFFQNQLWRPELIGLAAKMEADLPFV